MQLLDPVCGMVVDVATQRGAGLTMELNGREFAFCGVGCLKRFAKSPERFIPKVDAWIAAGRPAGASHM